MAEFIDDANVLGEGRSGFVDDAGLLGPTEISKPRPHIGQRMKRRFLEAFEAGKGIPEGTRKLIVPREGESRIEGGFQILRAITSPIEAVTSTLIGAPVEEALGGGLGLEEETARIGGTLAEFAVPLGLAKAGQAGKLTSGPAARATRSALGIPEPVPRGTMRRGEAEAFIRSADETQRKALGHKALRRLGRGDEIIDSRTINQEQLSEMATSAADTQTGFIAKYRQAVDAIAQKISKARPKVFQAGRGTELEFRETRAQMEADIANGVDQALSLGTGLKNELTISQKLRADQILRGSIIGDATPTRVVKLTEPVRAELDLLQKELTDLGRLSPETTERFQQTFGPYFARLYASKELVEKSAVIPSPNPLRAGTPRLKTRGERITVELPVPKVSSPVGKEQGIVTVNIRGDVVPVQAVANAESAKQRVDALKDVLAHGYRVESRDGRKVTLFRDIPEEIRTTEAGDPVFRTVDSTKTSIGFTKGAKTPGEVADILREKTHISEEKITEIEDKLQRFVQQRAAGTKRQQTLARITGEQAPTESFVEGKDIAEVIEDLRPTERTQIGVGLGELRGQPGFVAGKSLSQISREVAVNKFFDRVAKNPEWVSDVAKPGFVEMGDSEKTLGILAKKFIRSDVAAEINDVVRIRADWEKIVGRLTNMWKVGKVTNPATIGRNIMSSTLMADWGGLSPFRPSGMRSYSAAMRGLRRTDVEAMNLIAEAKKGGLYRSAFNQQEINALADGFLSSREENAALRLLDGTQALIRQVGDKFGNPTRFYGAVDEFFKSGLYIHGRKELGMNPTLALRFAKKYGIDYQDIAPATRFLRSFPFGAPFVTFSSKAIPLTLESSIRHPVRFWKWIAAGIGAEELSRQVFNSEREDIQQMKDLGNLKNPRFVLLPVKDKDGRSQFLDLGYILPFGDLVESYDLLTGGKGANLAFEIPGGPGKAFLEVTFNKNDFTGKPVYQETDSLLEAAAKVSDHLGKALLPAFAPPVPFTGFRGGHSVEQFRKTLKPEAQLPGEAPLNPEDFFGRRRTLGTAIASKVFGINVKSVSLRELKQLGVMDLDRQMGILSAVLVRIQRSGLTDAQKQVEQAKVVEKMKELGRATKQKISRVSPQEPTFIDDAGILEGIAQ